jgi:hypothetical protein
VEAFGAERAFVDVDSIRAGVDFRAEISAAIAKTIMLVLIGDRWLTAEDRGGRRRPDDPDDILRNEVAQALLAGIRVVPVLVGGASLPRSEQLPPDIALPPTLNSVTVGSRTVARDVAELSARVAPDARRRPPR